MCPVIFEISMYFYAVYSKSLHKMIGLAENPKLLQVDSEDSQQCPEDLSHGFMQVCWHSFLGFWLICLFSHSFNLTPIYDILFDQ